MSIETDFTPLAALAGGALIGAASVLLMALNGRIMGATGILAATVFDRRRGDLDWRIALLAGMVSAPALMWAVTGAGPVIEVPVSAAAMLIGGVLVGIGVTFGSGCTSGHGVCGMARLSRRSIAATATFMATTFATVYVARHLIGG